MKKYEIKENRPELTDDEIKQGMDFSKINNVVPKTKAFSIKKVLVAGITVAAIITAAIFWSDITGKGSADKKITEAKLPSTDNITDTFVVNSEKDTMLVYSSGTRIKIPANAFVDEAGTPVTGNINLNYREFHNVGEILLSAIPMRYDSAGKEMYFESAGMFDIGAKQNGKAIFIKNDKSLEVAMATLDRTEKKYNQYLLNEKTGDWAFIKKDEVATLTKSEPGPAAKADSIKATKPLKPVGERMFTIDATGRPDLEIYNGIVFEVTKDCKNFDPKEAKIDWGMVNVEKIDKTDKYKVTFSYPFSGPARTYEVTARPVKDGNMDAAIKKFDAMYADYKKRLTEAEKADMAAEQALKAQENTYETVFANYQALQEKNAALSMKNAMKVAEAEQVVYRTFQVKQFGVWNSDCPSSMPQGMEVMAKFETTGGEKVNIAVVYLVEKGKNALYNLYVPQKLSFNPDAENILLVITKDHKLGWVKNNVFESIGKDTKNFTFKLNMIDKENYTSSDIDGLII